MKPVINAGNQRKTRGKVLILLPLAIILHVSCGSDARRTIAVVADTKISRADIANRMAIEEAYGFATCTEQAMLVVLINDAIEAEVADRHGISVTCEDVKALDAHADETSKAPKILAKIRRIFGRDVNAYERMYLKPKIVTYKLHARFSRDADLHKKERSAIERAHRLALSGMPFDAVARACALSYSIDTIRAMPAPHGNHVSSDAMKIHPLFRILSIMKTATVYEEIIEDDIGFLILKLIRQEGPDYLCQRIAVKKKDFDKWLIEQTSEIRVRFMDSVLRKKVLEDYPDLWWTRNII